jgi:hypothetical protein
MNLTDAEVFLMIWAVIATASSAYYSTKYKTELQEKETLMEAVIGVAKGEAEISLRGNRVSIKEKQDGNSTGN